MTVWWCRCCVTSRGERAGSSSASIRFSVTLTLFSMTEKSSSAIIHRRSVCLLDRLQPSKHTVQLFERNIREEDVDQYGTAITGPAAESSAFQSPTFPLLPCFGTKTPQTAQLQSIYNCSIMEDVPTCERPGTQHMNVNKLYSHTDNEQRGKTECVCATGFSLMIHHLSLL